MKLEFIPLDKLFVDKANMRHGASDPAVSDILPSVRKRGIVQPILVRPADADRFGVVAGRRRLCAARIVAGERADDSDAQRVACAILDASDDAAAIEASMIENMMRLDPDEVSRWESFVRLVRQGQTPEDIALTFALPELAVRRVLALGNLLPRLRSLYRAAQIDAVTVRHLTMASKAQQKAWLALRDDSDAWAPCGHQLKAWLFGGQSIPARHALFALDGFEGSTVADLFGEDRFFADPEAFWRAQNAEIEARRALYIEEGWSDVVVLQPGAHFHSWEHEKTPKRKGGRVYVDVRANGEVTFHEGYLGRKEAARVKRGEGEAAAKPARPEVTGAMQTYIDLHRHAAVRAALTGHPHVALRLLVAHAIIGSHLFRVTPEPQIATNDAVRESVETCRGETLFDEKRRAVLAVLGFDSEAPTVIDGNPPSSAVPDLFRRLLDLPDSVVLEVVAIVMGEALASGSPAVEAAGLQLGVSMSDWWQADAAFFGTLRDREVLGRIVAEVAGEGVAEANRDVRSSALKAIVQDCLGGTNGRAQVTGWVPRWMAFPPATYTGRGGVGTVRAAGRVVAAGGGEDDPAPVTPVDALAIPEGERLAA